MNGIFITGPTTSGKTKIAYELARKINGEVINFDLTQTYKGFEISSSSSDALNEKDIKKHLYGFLEPDEKPLTPEEYSELVIKTAKEIISRNKIPIVEGGAVKYFKSFFEKNKETKLFKHFFHITRKKDKFLDKKILERINQFLKDGLIEEIERNLAKGYRYTKFMREGKAVVPAIKYLDNQIDMETMKNEIVDGILDLKQYQDNAFSKYSEPIVIVNGKNSLEEILGYLE